LALVKIDNTNDKDAILNDYCH